MHNNVKRKLRAEPSAQRITGIPFVGLIPPGCRLKPESVLVGLNCLSCRRVRPGRTEVLDHGHLLADCLDRVICCHRRLHPTPWLSSQR
jgi:hypothetical protein